MKGHPIRYSADLEPNVAYRLHVEFQCAAYDRPGETPTADLGVDVVIRFE